MGNFDALTKMFKALGKIHIKINGEPAKEINEIPEDFEWHSPRKTDVVAMRLQKLKDRRKQWSKVRPPNDWRKR